MNGKEGKAFLKRIPLSDGIITVPRDSARAGASRIAQRCPAYIDAPCVRHWAGYRNMQEYD